MGIPIIYGTKIEGQHIDDVIDFCGVCLEDTEHAILALHQRSHVYFISFGRGSDVGRARRCETCGSSVPDLDREDVPEDELMVDAFLDAHVLPVERADKSVVVGFAGLGVALLGLALFVGYWQVAAALELPTLAYLIGAVVAAAATIGVYLYVQRRVGNWVLGRAAGDRLRKLRELTSWSATDIADRAGARGFRRLASFLSWHAAAQKA